MLWYCYLLEMDFLWHGTISCSFLYCIYHFQHKFLKAQWKHWRPMVSRYIRIWCYCYYLQHDNSLWFFLTYCMVCDYNLTFSCCILLHILVVIIRETPNFRPPIHWDYNLPNLLLEPILFLHNYLPSGQIPLLPQWVGNRQQTLRWKREKDQREEEVHKGLRPKQIGTYSEIHRFRIQWWVRSCTTDHW